MCIRPEELPAISAMLATAICKGLTIDEIHVYRSLFIAIATEMSSVAQARSLCEKQDKAKANLSSTSGTSSSDASQA